MPDTDYSINIDEIIANVAKKNKTIIKPDDELLAVVFLNEELLKHHFYLIQEEHKKLQSYFEEIAAQQIDKTKNIINLSSETATNNSKNVLSKEMKNYFNEFEKNLKFFNKDFNKEREIFYKTTKKLKYICIGSATFSFILSMLILASFFV